MTQEATENHDAARRDGSGLERVVRPAAWKRKGGDLRGVSYFPMENGDEPLYDQAALDAAVAAERTRMAERIEEAFRDGYSSRATYNDTETSCADDQWASAKAWLLRA